MSVCCWIISPFVSFASLCQFWSQKLFWQATAQTQVVYRIEVAGFNYSEISVADALIWCIGVEGLRCPGRGGKVRGFRRQKSPRNWKLLRNTTKYSGKEICDQVSFSMWSSHTVIIIITTTMFMLLSSWQSHCESSPGSFDECRMVPSGRRPKTKPDDLGCESACTGCQKLHPPSPFYYYSAQKLILILPSHGG